MSTTFRFLDHKFEQLPHSAMQDYDQAQQCEKRSLWVSEAKLLDKFEEVFVRETKGLVNQ